MQQIVRVILEVGKFVFYKLDGLEESQFLVGKVIDMVNGLDQEVRTDSDGMQTVLGVSTRTDWVWVDGKYVLPKPKETWTDPNEKLAGLMERFVSEQKEGAEESDDFDQRQFAQDISMAMDNFVLFLQRQGFNIRKLKE